MEFSHEKSVFNTSLLFPESCHVTAFGGGGSIFGLHGKSSIECPSFTIG